MRINGFEQIKAFYSWVFDNQDLYIKPQHISLYMFLINQNNRNNWVEWFKVPRDLAMAGACLSNKKTYYSCLSDLQEWKLIQYQPGVNDYKAPLVKVEVLYSTSAVPQLLPQSEPLLQPQATPQHIPQPTPQVVPQVYTIYKPITYNNKQVTGNLQHVTACEENLEEVADLNFEKELLKFFGFNEVANFDKLRIIAAFIFVQKNSGRFDYFKKQFDSYRDFKNLSGQQKHNFNSFFGKQENQFSDGHWDDANWTDKLKEEKEKNSAQKEKENAGQMGRSERVLSVHEKLQQKRALEEQTEINHESQY